MRGLTFEEYDLLNVQLQSMCYVSHSTYESLHERGCVEGDWEDFGITDLGNLAARVSEQRLGM